MKNRKSRKKKAKKADLSKLFGSLKFNKPTQEILDECRERED